MGPAKNYHIQINCLFELERTSSTVSKIGALEVDDRKRLLVASHVICSLRIHFEVGKLHYKHLVTHPASFLQCYFSSSMLHPQYSWEILDSAVLLSCTALRNLSDLKHIQMNGSLLVLKGTL